MLTDAQAAALEAAWSPARAAGVLGAASLTDLWEHTAGYTSAVCSSFSTDVAAFDGRIVDVGTGAGVPGVLVALQLPRAQLVLVDSSERRLDHVRRAVRAVGLGDRVSVVHTRGDALAHDPAARGSFDVAVARLLADPSETLEQLLPLVRDGGVVAVSLAQRAEAAWKRLPVAGVPSGEAVFFGDGADRFVTVVRKGELPADLPRREKHRRRAPLLES